MPGSRCTGPNPVNRPSPTHPDQIATNAGNASNTRVSRQDRAGCGTVTEPGRPGCVITAGGISVPGSAEPLTCASGSGRLPDPVGSCSVLDPASSVGPDSAGGGVATACSIRPG